jgi:benzoyl-CoA reductase/2-hydroxyglutaryl-CoA dehydratase subunit BcrC/BadD/HgdB
LNLGVGDKLIKIRQLVTKYHLNGVILHSNRSCKPYSIGQLDQRDYLVNKYDIPALLLEADQSDPRSYSQDQVTNRLEAFCEMLGET